MTTIAYDGRTISADGRATQGTVIINDNFCKFYKVNDYCWAVMAGAVVDCKKFLEEFKHGGEPTKEYLCNGYLLEPNGVVSEIYSNLDSSDGNKNKFVKLELHYEDFDGSIRRPCDATGTGADHALTAMDLGCNSRKAVEMAIKRDPKSGGRILTFDVFKFEFIE